MLLCIVVQVEKIVVPASNAIVEDKQLQCLANFPFLLVGNVKAQGSIGSCL